MKTTGKLLSLAFLTVGLSWGQTYYSVTKSTTLVASTEVVTVQQPAAGRVVRFQGVYFKCDVACTIYLENNGTKASSTALSVVPVNSVDRSAVTQAFYSSNVGSGTVLKQFTLAAGDWRYVDLTGYKFLTKDVNSNLTVRTSTISGNVDIIFTLTEADQ